MIHVHSSHNRDTVIATTRSLRIEVSATTVAQQLMDSRNELGVPATTVNAKAVEEWRGKNWTAALPMYLASLSPSYHDTGAGGATTADEVLDHYARQSDPPPSFTPRGARLPLVPPTDSSHSRRSTVESLRLRRSCRRFSGATVGLETMSTLLYEAMAGVRSARHAADRLGDRGLRVSFGSAIEIFVIPHNVAGLAHAAHYDVKSHALTIQSARIDPDHYVQALFGQRAPETAGFSVALVLNLLRYAWTYRHERALRSLFLEVGRIGQGLIIAAGRLDMAALPTPAIDDRRMCQLLEVDGRRFYPAYSITIGRPGPQVESRR